MALGDIPTPSFPRSNSVQNMLLSGINTAAPASNALTAALGSGAVTPGEYGALANITPRNTNAQVRAFVSGQMTPDEFLQSQRIASNRALTAATGAGDDLLAQALARSGGGAAAATPVANAYTAALGQAAPGALNAGQITSAIGGIGAPAAQAGKAGFMARLMGRGGGPLLSKGGLLKGLGFGAAGLIGGGLIDNANIGGEGSNWDNALSDAAVGAGIGAGIGSVVPGIGTAAGGLIGGASGALWGLVKGDKTNKEGRIEDAYQGTKGIIQSLGNQYGLNESYLNNIMLEFDAAAQIMMQQGDEAGLEQLVNTMETNLPSTLLQYRMEQEAEKKQTDRIMSIQSSFAPIFNSIQARSGQNQTVAYEQALVAADTLEKTNPQLAALVRSNSSQSRASSDAVMAAYASQAALGMSGNLEAANAFAQNTQPVNL